MVARRYIQLNSPALLFETWAQCLRSVTHFKFLHCSALQEDTSILSVKSRASFCSGHEQALPGALRGDATVCRGLRALPVIQPSQAHRRVAKSLARDSSDVELDCCVALGRRSQSEVPGSSRLQRLVVSVPAWSV